MELKVKLSARNTLKGKVVDIKMGQTTAHIKLDIGAGNVVRARRHAEQVPDRRTPGHHIGRTDNTRRNGRHVEIGNGRGT